jgi:excisionase family DNA binding protein
MDLTMTDAPPNGLQPHNPQRLSLLTAREAAEYLRVSLSTLYRMEQNGRLTPLRTPGGHRRYTLPMLNACLASGELEADLAPAGAALQGS